MATVIIDGKKVKIDNPTPENIYAVKLAMRGEKAPPPMDRSDGLLGRYAGPAQATAKFASDIVSREGDVNVASTPAAAASVTKFLNPFPTSTTTNPIQILDEKRRWLEGAGRKFKEATLGSVGNIVSDVSGAASEYLPSGAANVVRNAAAMGGGTLATAAELMPTRPSDFALEAGMGIAGPMVSRATRGIQTEIANRNLQAPKLIRESRYMKGQPRVGEVALDMDKGVANLATSNKEKMEKAATRAINKLGGEIEGEISNVSKTSAQQVAGAPNRIKPDLTSAPAIPPNSIVTKEVADAMNPVIQQAARRYNTTDHPVVQSLIEYKNNFMRRMGDFMDFMNANIERVFLGDEIGKSFNKDTSAIPEITEAQRAMWIALREKLGAISPTLDKKLGLQHELIDVRTSAIPEAARGFTKTADNVVDLAKSPFRRMGLADFLGNQMSSKKTIGLGMETGAVAKSGEDKRGRKQRR